MLLPSLCLFTLFMHNGGLFVRFTSAAIDSAIVRPTVAPLNSSFDTQQQFRVQWQLQQLQQEQQQMPPLAESLIGASGGGTISQQIGGGGGGGGSTIPVFPERSDAVYFIVAVAGGANSWARTLARTLLDIGPSFGSPQGPPLRPIYVDLPQNGRFSSRVLTSLCHQIEQQPLSGMIVIGEGQSARAVALSGNAMKLPVLWAKGGTASLHGLHREMQTSLQSMLQPSAKEILEAIRALFLQTHWHSFFVLSDVEATMVLSGSEGQPLKAPPLVPTMLPLSASHDDVFRQLAKISRSTRGIVLLFCDLVSARHIMAEAQRLNMAGGHFIWIWADTSSKIEFFDMASTVVDTIRSPAGVHDHNTHDANIYDSLSSLAVHEDVIELDEYVDKSDSRIAAHHLDDLAERKMDFEDFNAQFDRNKVNAKQKSGSTNKFAHIIGLNDDGNQASSGVVHKRESNDDGMAPTSPSEVLRTDRKPNRNQRRRNRSAATNADTEFAASLAFETSDLIDNGEQKLHPALEQYLKNVYAGRDRMPGKKSGDDTFGYDEDDDRDADEDGADHRNAPVQRTFPSSFDSKLKRVPAQLSKYSNASSHVLFHHFKDFPVGLLALRPVRMTVDRHFIRSTIRLFASTWARVESEPAARADDAAGAPKTTRPNKSYNKSKSAWHNERFPFAGGDMADSDEAGDRRPPRNGPPPLGGNTKSRSNAKSGQRNVRSPPNADAIMKSLQSNSILNSQNVIQTFNETTNHNNHNLNNLNASKVNGDLNSSIIIMNNIQNQNQSALKQVNINTKSNNILAQQQQEQKQQQEQGHVAPDEVATDTGLFKPIANKRQNTWWLAKDNLWKPRTPDRVATATGTGTTTSGSTTRRAGAPIYNGGCFGTPSRSDTRRAEYFAKVLTEATHLALSGQRLFDGSQEKALTTQFELLNLVPALTNPSPNGDATPVTAEKVEITKWRRVGLVSGRNVHLDTIVWPGGDIVVSGLSARARSVFRVVTALAPPFVMESELDEDGLCLRGLPCHHLATSGRHNLTLMFNAMETRDRLEEDAAEHGNQLPPNADTDSKVQHKTMCCYGLSMDLLDNIATELGFEFHLYIIRDELFGTKFSNFNLWRSHLKGDTSRQHNDRNSTAKESGYNQPQSHTKIGSNQRGRDGKMGRDEGGQRSRSLKDQWNGIVGDLVTGAADMSFAALSVSKARAEAIDFSMPYFHSGVSLLAAPQVKSEIPLLAFLLPFSPELWIAIFTSLNITAVAVAVYEWLSPFGLNPWGRQRSKNFSMSSALWVMWGLLCGHLVAFKAPKSWPNKFLINVWGGFSVIFVASYTANIAALIAGLFFHNAASNYEASLLTQRVGTPTASAAESYVQNNDKHLWEHMKKYTLRNIEDGIRGLKNGTLDLLLADSPVLDYYRATDHGCNLQRIGETYVEDTYAIGMTKGFPLRDSISSLIAKYSSNGYLDILTEKWYGGLPCFKLDRDMAQPTPLGVAAVAGVFLLLGLGMILGVLILIFEHGFYKWTLPILRHKPKGTVWKSRNIMFFSQKLYRFINCVELVSPHHAARELVHTLRQGQIASLFQKSIKRKEDEQRRRRKSKAQFFEMIQEIRRVQQEERDAPPLSAVAEVDANLEAGGLTVCTLPPKPPKMMSKPRLFTNKKDTHKKDTRSRSNSSGLNVRRFSTDSILEERLDTIGRRLSRDLSYSPPDIGHRFETFGKGHGLNKFDTFAGNEIQQRIEANKFDTFGGKSNATVSGMNNINNNNNNNNTAITNTATTPNAPPVAAKPLPATQTSDYEKPAIPPKPKKSHSKRMPLSMDLYNNHKETGNKSIGHEDPAATAMATAPAVALLRDKLAPPVLLSDSTRVVLRDKLHEELRSKYANKRRPVNRRAAPAALHPHPVAREKLPTTQSRLVIGVKPIPSPRQGRDENAVSRSRNGDMTLGKLTREDLLRLSESTEAEICEYLNNSTATPKRSEQPP